ncbi:hypothetical protein [Duganella sp. S19_KUP01_CR8]|uniref:hypothetical protein n=1 Tax=Duganella sp. S19_KUP01_CR8 TaxID=3025502 RepID=UPI002FCD6FB5
MKLFRCLPALLFLASTLALAGQIKTKDEAIKLAIDAIHKYHLTTLNDECGLADIIEKPLYFEIVGRERHTKNCGGTPETGPRLFNVRVRKHDGQLTSDVYDGTNYKLVNH